LVPLGLGLCFSHVCQAAGPIVCDELLIQAEARRARVWRYSWTGVNAVLTAGSFAAVPFVDRESRPDWVVSGVGSAVTTVLTYAWPLRVESAEEELTALPAAERSKHLRRLLLESAEDEHDRVTWPWHLANFGLSALGGGIIAFGYGHYESGVITTLAGVALGEAQLLTQPTGLPHGCTLACPTLTPRFVALRATAGQLNGGVLSLAGAF
jgi:hypothetical protein